MSWRSANWGRTALFGVAFIADLLGMLLLGVGLAVLAVFFLMTDVLLVSRWTAKASHQTPTERDEPQ